MRVLQEASAPPPAPPPAPAPATATATVVTEAVPAPSTVSGDVDPIAALDALLEELERATVRIDGAAELDEQAVVELEQLASKLHAAAGALSERVA